MTWAVSLLVIIDSLRQPTQLRLTRLSIQSAQSEFRASTSLRYWPSRDVGVVHGRHAPLDVQPRHRLLRTSRTLAHPSLLYLFLTERERERERERQDRKSMRFVNAFPSFVTPQTLQLQVICLSVCLSVQRIRHSVIVANNMRSHFQRYLCHSVKYFIVFKTSH